MPAEKLLYPRETLEFLESLHGGYGDTVRNPDHNSKRTTEEVEQKLQNIIQHLTAKKILDPIGVTLQRGFVNEDEETYGKFHPLAVARKILEGHVTEEKLEAYDAENLLRILRASYPEDNVTGYTARASHPVMAGLSYLIAQHANPEAIPVTIMEGDIVNLGGCNRTLGEKDADKAIHQICSITKEEIINAFPDKTIEVQAVRVGGDEIKLMVFGAPPEVIQQILEERIYPKVNILTAQLGLHTIDHTKALMGKLSGMSVGFGVANLATKDTDTLDFSRNLNVQIEQQKQEQSLLINGVTTPEALDAYIQKSFIPSYKARNEDREPSDTEIREERSKMLPLVARLQQKWEHILLPATLKLYGKENIAQEIHKTNPQSLFSYMVLADNAVILSSIEIKPLENIFPFSTKDFEKFDEPASSIHLRAALRDFGLPALANTKERIVLWNKDRHRHELNGELIKKHLPNNPHNQFKLDMLLGMMHLYEAPHPVSRVTTTRDMEFDIQGIRNRKNTETIQRIEVDVQNINGINNISPELTNAVIREFGKRVYGALNDVVGEKARDYFYHDTAGKFHIILTDCNRKNLQLVEEKIQEIIASIATEDIVAFAQRTYARKTPEAIKLELAGTLVRKYGALSMKIGEVPHPKNDEILFGVKINTREESLKPHTRFPVEEAEIVSATSTPRKPPNIRERKI